MYVLDTSAAIEILDNTDKGRAIAERVAAADWFLTPFTVYELLIADEVGEALAFIEKARVVYFDKICGRISAGLQKQLKKRGKPAGTIDFFIAATCISVNFTLLTTDRGFEEIPGLKKIVY